MSIKEVREDIKALHEGTVYYFGAEHELPECDKFTIDALDILDALADYECEYSLATILTLALK